MELKLELEPEYFPDTKTWEVDGLIASSLKDLKELFPRHSFKGYNPDKNYTPNFVSAVPKFKHVEPKHKVRPVPPKPPPPPKPWCPLPTPERNTSKYQTDPVAKKLKGRIIALADLLPKWSIRKIAKEVRANPGVVIGILYREKQKEKIKAIQAQLEQVMAEKEPG